MSTLSDRDIQKNMESGRIVVHSANGRNLDFAAEPWRLQPASVELTLADSDLLGYGRDVVSYDKGRPVSHAVIDPENPPPLTRRSWWRANDGRSFYLLSPGELVLGCVAETVEVSSSLCAKIEGKSSLGRLGLFVHVSAGFVDPGWKGRTTLELFNAAPRAIRLWAGMRIGQLRFEWLSSAAERPYGSMGLSSHYQGSLRPVQAASIAPEAPEGLSEGEPSALPVTLQNLVPAGPDRFA